MSTEGRTAVRQKLGLQHGAMWSFELNWPEKEFRTPYYTTWFLVASWWTSWFTQQKSSFTKHHPVIPFRELTYPTWGKGISSSEVPFWGIVTRRVNVSKKNILNWSHFSKSKWFFVSVFLPLHRRSLCDPFWFNLCCFSFSKQKHCHLPFGSTPFPDLWDPLIKKNQDAEREASSKELPSCLTGNWWNSGMILELTKQVFHHLGICIYSMQNRGWKIAAPVMRSPLIIFAGRDIPKYQLQSKERLAIPPIMSWCFYYDLTTQFSSSSIPNQSHHISKSP